MKKVLFALLLTVCILLMFSACSSLEKNGKENTESNSVSEIETEVSEENNEPIIELEIKDTEIEVGKSITLNVSKNEKCTGEVSIICDNEEVIKVEGTTLKAITPGTATIYAKCDNAESKKVKVSCVVYATQISLDKTSAEVEVGDSVTLKATLLPENVTNTKISWSSENKEVAVVNSNGTVTGKGVGQTNIVATDSKHKVVVKCSVKVNPIEVTDVVLSDKKIELQKGQKFILYSNVKPSNATYKSLSYSMSNDSVAKYADNIITAKSIGTAVLTIKAKNGVKDTFTIIVSEKKSSKTMYTTETLNVRKSANKESESIDKVSPGTRIEVIKNGKWAMVNTPSGKVGYVYSQYLSSTKPIHISGVPYLNQFQLGFPTGCEAVSGTMLLNYYGYKVSAQKIVNATPNGPAKEKNNGVWYGANPFEYFVGNPSLNRTHGSYGCFAKPLAKAMSTVAGSRVKNISGCASDRLFDYLDQGKPVVVWCIKNAGDVKNGVRWKYPDGSGYFDELYGEHCAVLIGYDSKYVYLNDPSAGKNVTQPKSKFISNWKKLYSQALVIE